MRFVGGIAAGTAADRWGRKGPLMLSILWFSIFACLSGFSTSYAMLFGFRALFGIGMGGEWAAGMPLVLEHWPGGRGGAVWHRACCWADGTGAIYSPPLSFSTSILGSAPDPILPGARCSGS